MNINEPGRSEKTRWRRLRRLSTELNTQRNAIDKRYTHCRQARVLSIITYRNYTQSQKRATQPLLIKPQTSIQRLETPLGWASGDPFAFVMLMSTSRCTARHSGACRCAPIDFACPCGSRFRPKQGSDSSRRARDTAATMLHFTHFWRYRGESAMKHCQLYNCTCKKCVYMNISDKN